MIKTNKLGAILVVSSWAVLGVLVYHDIQEVRAERRVDRLTQLQYKIVHESEHLRRPFWNRGDNRWEKLKRAKCKDVQRSGPLKVTHPD